MQLLYGKNKSISLNIDSSTLVLSNPDGSECSTIELTSDAIEHPLGLPSINKAFTPDDTVAIALGEGIPHEVEIVSTLIDHLCELGIKKENVTIVSFGGKYRDSAPPSAHPHAWRPETPEEAQTDSNTVKTHVHFTDQPQAYTIVSTMESGEPLAFVRPLVESDVVIPIGVADTVGCCSPWTSHLGVFSSIYPRFAMKESHDRFDKPALFGLQNQDDVDDIAEDVRNNVNNYKRTDMDEFADLEQMAKDRWEHGEQKTQRETNPHLSENSGYYSDCNRNMSQEIRSDLAQETQVAGWQLGIILLMEIVPGTGDSIANIVFGIPDEVEKKVSQLHHQTRKQFDKSVVSGIGKLKFVRKPTKVLCTLGGAENRQTWLNAIEILESATEHGSDKCQIYFCADVTEKIGLGLQVVIDGFDLLAGNIANVSATLYKEKFPDSLLALRWLRLVERHRIYWLSNLDTQTVENLGAVPVESVEELQRLIAQP